MASVKDESFKILKYSNWFRRTAAETNEKKKDCTCRNNNNIPLDCCNLNNVKPSGSNDFIGVVDLHNPVESHGLGDAEISSSSLPSLSDDEYEDARCNLSVASESESLFTCSEGSEEMNALDLNEDVTPFTACVERESEQLETDENQESEISDKYSGENRKFRKLNLIRNLINDPHSKLEGSEETGRLNNQTSVQRSPDSGVNFDDESSHVELRLPPGDRISILVSQVEEKYKKSCHTLGMLSGITIFKFINKYKQKYVTHYKMCRNKRQGSIYPAVVTEDMLKDQFKCNPFNSVQQLALMDSLLTVTNVTHQDFVGLRIIILDVMPHAARDIFAWLFHVRPKSAAQLIKKLFPVPVRLLFKR